MTLNALTSMRGYQWVRVNGGPSIDVQNTLHLIGANATDDEARDRTVVEVTRQVWIAMSVDLPPLEDSVYHESTPDWFGVSPDFQPASDVYVNPTAANIMIAWLAPPTSLGTYRKHIFNASATYKLTLSNTLLGTSPGYLMGRARQLAPNEGCRIKWDPVGLRWLVNDGLASGNYVTHLGEIVTHDEEIVTVD